MSSDRLLPRDSSSGRKPDPANSVSRGDAVPWSDAAGQGEVLRLIEALTVRAARIIAQRDTRGGFQSLDELDSLYGIPRELIEELKRSVTI
jgi:Helix-hairpin-helix motif